MNKTELSIATSTERMVVACQMEHGLPALLKAIERGVAPNVLTDPLSRRVQELILRHHAGGLPFDLSFLWKPLNPSPEEAAALTEMTREPVGMELSLPRLCSELRDLAVRRKTIELSAQLADAAKNDPDEMPAIIGELLAIQADTATARTWKQVCDAAEVRAQDAIAGKRNDEDFISWGFPKLDLAFKQMRKGELDVLAARTSVGKSSFARDIVRKNALAGKRVLFESLEVSADDVIDAMATGDCGLPYAELGNLPMMDQGRFLNSIARLRAAPLHICEDRTLAGIIARAKAMHSQQPIDLLVVDYLGQVADCKPGKGETTAQAVGTVTKALKRLAMELRIVVLCLAQLNRQSVNEGNREPRLSDLRDSGDIEQDADRVVFIHRPDECPISKRPQSPLDDVADLPRYGCALIQAKGRNVGTAFGAVWFNRRLARFELEAPSVSHAPIRQIVAA